VGRGWETVGRCIGLWVGRNVALRDREKGAGLGSKIVWIDGEGMCRGGWAWVGAGHLTIGVSGEEAL
jgi:hypothetical protein